MWPHQPSYTVYTFGHTKDHIWCMMTTFNSTVYSYRISKIQCHGSIQFSFIYIVLLMMETITTKLQRIPDIKFYFKFIPNEQDRSNNSKEEGHKWLSLRQRRGTQKGSHPLLGEPNSVIIINLSIIVYYRVYRIWSTGVLLGMLLYWLKKCASRARLQHKQQDYL